MKRKFRGIVSIGVLSAMIVMILLYYFSGLWRRVYTPSGPVQTPYTDSWMPSEEQIKTIHRLAGSLQTLAVPVDRKTETSALALFGQRMPPTWRRGDPADSLASQTVHGLSLTLLAGPFRYCILDGVFTAEGAHLSDGTRVMKIENQRVLIAKGNKLEWLPLKDDPTATDWKNASSALPGKGSL